MFLVRSDAKLNLSLRVTGKRPDGFHEIRSIFFRLPAVESLTITPQYGHNVRDLLTVSGEEVKGENILERIIRQTRQTVNLPFLHISLVKNVPIGSGMGGGSGNGAALLRWIGRFTGEKTPDPSEFGSDIPFLTDGDKWALVGGRGEKVSPLSSLPSSPSVVVAVPDWHISTKKAFSLLSEERRGKFPLSSTSAEAEIQELIETFRAGRKASLLPNDFAPFLLEAQPEYNAFFEVFERYGSSAWGITGSGSACFALFFRNRPSCGLFREMAGWKRVRKIFYLE